MYTFLKFDAERRCRHDLRSAPLLRFPRRAWEREQQREHRRFSRSHALRSSLYTSPFSTTDLGTKRIGQLAKNNIPKKGQP